MIEIYGDEEYKGFDYKIRFLIFVRLNKLRVSW